MGASEIDFILTVPRQGSSLPRPQHQTSEKNSLDETRGTSKKDMEST